MLLPLWWMELSHWLQADVIPMQQMEQPHVWQLMLLLIVADGIANFVNGWCYCHCGRWNSHLVGMFSKADLIAWWQMLKPLGHYFSLSSMLLIRTSSHMWGRWYLPMFLFRDGLLTLMNIYSLINQERFCSSLPIMLKLSSVVEWPVIWLWS